jgi:hypothetical protein
MWVVPVAVTGKWCRASPGGGMMLNVTLEDGNAAFDVTNASANKVRRWPSCCLGYSSVLNILALNNAVLLHC